MPHSNGKVYYTSQYGVSIEDVRETLDVGIEDIGNPCVSPYVNPFAKYKPIDFNGYSPTEAQRRTINYGITPPNPSSTPAGTQNSYWTYTKPTGGNSSPYRLRDFAGYAPSRGYNHNAVSPIVCAGDVTVSESDGSGVSLAMFSNVVDSLTLEDFGDLEGYYLCVYMTFTSGGSTFVSLKTADASFGETLSPVLKLYYDELDSISSGTRYYLCLCDTKQTELGLPPGGAKYLPIPRFSGASATDYSGIITKESGYDVVTTFDLVIQNNSVPSSVQFTAPAQTNYFNPPSPAPDSDPDPRYYFNCGNYTSLSLRFKMPLLGSQIYGNSIYVNMSPSFYGSPTARNKATVYAYENGTVSVVTGRLSAGVTYILALANDSLVLNSSNQRGGPIPSTVQYLRPIVRLYDGGGEDSVQISSTQLGLRNG